MTAIPQPDADPADPADPGGAVPRGTASPASPGWPPDPATGPPTGPAWEVRRPWPPVVGGPGPRPVRGAGIPEPRIRLTAPEDLVAALPVLIGFHPADSLVLVGLAGAEQRGRVGLTVRVDLPAGRDVRRVCADAVSVLRGSGPARAVAVVVRGAPAAAPRRGRRDVAVAARRELRLAGIEPMAVLWASGTRAGDRWSCYPLPGQRCGCAGEVPDPSSTPVAVAAAVQGGRAVLPDRAAVRAQLDGDAGDRARRARLRPEQARDRTLPGEGGPCPAGYRALLGAALADAERGGLVVDDRRAAEFGAALGDPGLRDEALRRSLGEDAPHAEQLWAVLTRALPPPQRAHAAALLAACALLRGDGALATLAVEHASAGCPGHVLAAVVDASLRDAVTPGRTPGRFAGPGGLRTLLTALLDGTGGEPGGGPAGGAGGQPR